MKVGIIGLGLIGGSLAKAYRRDESITVLGMDTDHSILEFAQLAEAIHGPLTEENLKTVDLLLLATYPEAVVEHMERLVIKDVAEAGGYGVFFGRDLDSKKKADFIDLMKAEPRRFIAQEIIDFIDLPIMDNGLEVMRKADLRAFVLSGSDTKVWPSGLTRFSRNPDSFVVNSSQGGGFKDTWVLSR